MLKDYGFGKTVKMSYGEAVAKTKSALKDKGWGVLSEIDVCNTMKEIGRAHV